MAKRASDDPAAASILEENPIALEIGGLHLTAFSTTELRHVIELLIELRTNPPEFSDDPNFLPNIEQFRRDFDALIEGTSYPIQISAAHVTNRTKTTDPSAQATPHSSGS